MGKPTVTIHGGGLKLGTGAMVAVQLRFLTHGTPDMKKHLTIKFSCFNFCFKTFGSTGAGVVITRGMCCIHCDFMV